MVVWSQSASRGGSGVGARQVARRARTSAGEPGAGNGLGSIQDGAFSPCGGAWGSERKVRGGGPLWSIVPLVAASLMSNAMRVHLARSKKTVPNQVCHAGGQGEAVTVHHDKENITPISKTMR